MSRSVVEDMVMVGGEMNSVMMSKVVVVVSEAINRCGSHENG